LSVIVADLGGSLEVSPSGMAAAFDERRIAIRFRTR
jgi:hypothetical protein